VLVAIGLANGRPAPVPPGLDASAAAAQTPVTTATTAVAAAPAPGTPPAAPPPAAPAVPRITAIGDSVMLGARTALEQRLGSVRVDATVSRQFGHAIELARWLRDSNQLSDVVVVHMGTNGIITQGHIDAMMEVLRDRKRVVYLNLKVPRRWEGPDNDVLRANIPRFSNAVLIDWHSVGNAHPEWFYEDGFHLRPDGARAYADLIAQQVAENP
jgi:lysophospholipase L1-like esterase